MDQEYNTEIKRIANEYVDRDKRLHTGDWRRYIYHPRNPMGRLFYEHQINFMTDALNYLDMDLEDKAILDFGCGTGMSLRILSELGAKPSNLTGIDLSEKSISIAKDKNPGINWQKVDGSEIPFPEDTFDIVMQLVVFSSIIDEGLARRLAGEMLRVTKPGGYVFWIDHKASHSNKLSGYPRSKMLEYFADCDLAYEMPVQPRYIRRWYGRPWLTRLLYHFTKNNCDSLFLVFRKRGQV